MKIAHIFVAVALAALAGMFARVAAADEIEVDPDSFAAIAYSPSTGEFRYAYNYEDRGSAEQAALKTSTAKDARIVCWVNEGFCALALGDDKSAWGTGYQFGNGANTNAAKATALAECKKRTTGAHIVVCLSSDGQYISRPVFLPARKVEGSSAAAPVSNAPPPSTAPNRSAAPTGGPAK
jgi:hypothetical protein